MLKNGIFDPEGGFPRSQLVRAHPTMDSLRPYQGKKIEEYAKRYMDFLDKVKIAPDAVKEALKIAEEANFYSRGKNFNVVNDDKTAFALVRFGKKPIKEGLRIIYSHTDAPCLQVKVKPLNLQWDPDLKELHLGVEIDTFGYGGIHPYQWTGRTLEVKGWSNINGRRREICFIGYSPDVAPHTDTRKENIIEFRDAHLEEFLDVVPGHKSRKDLLKELKFKMEDDFARARFYAVPIVKSHKLHKYYVTGYGHDNRVGVFASVLALLEQAPKYTTIVIGFDKEEVGSGGQGGARGKFFERIIHKTLKIEENRRLEEITDAVLDDIYKKSIAINADVDIGSTHREVDEVDIRNVGKLGFGMFIAGTDGAWEGDQQSPALVDRVMGVLQRRNIIFQTVGCPVPADRKDDLETMNKFMIDRGIPTINAGLVVGGLHSPESIIQAGDLFHAIEGYKAFIEDPQYVVKKKRRKRKS